MNHEMNAIIMLQSNIDIESKRIKNTSTVEKADVASSIP